jgi:hypothetical protein
LQQSILIHMRSTSRRQGSNVINSHLLILLMGRCRDRSTTQLSYRTPCTWSRRQCCTIFVRNWHK